jgi:outer membrane murein-binding lipoprotein Lpp
MIRGVDRDIRKAVKDAAKAEGISVGTWVRRSLVRGLDAGTDAPATVMDLSKHVRLLSARLSLLEKSHRALHREVHAAERPAAKSASEKRWRPTRKSR